MAHKISEIKGLDAALHGKLAESGVTTVEQLLEQAGTAAKRTALAAKVGVDGKMLTEWINRADLMRLKGVGTEFANLLEECGVDSCKELQHRVAANLQAKLKAANDEHHITHHAPTVAQVEEWIAEAATFAAA